MSSHDTIFALSSGPPPAAIAVIRISGPNARFGLETLIRRLPAPRRASLAKFFDPATGAVLDEGLALWFPGPRSETGEDMVELHLHGGRVIIAATVCATGLPSRSPARPMPANRACSTALRDAKRRSSRPIRARPAT